MVDGDIDLLSASQNDNKIAWYKNYGNGNFSSQQTITTSAELANDVFAADLDNDGQKDIIFLASLDKKIAWYKNQGNGNFGEQQVISLNVNITNVYATDLDNDEIPIS